MNLKTSFLIEIPKRAQTCCKCQTPFKGGEEYQTALFEGAQDVPFERCDFCLPCFQKNVKENADSLPLSTWKSVVPMKKEESPLPKQKDDRAMYLLKEALAKNDEQSIEEAFILALYLARKRILAMRQEVPLENQRKGLVYEVLETEEMLCVPKVPLNELAIEKVQEELAKKFRS